MRIQTSTNERSSEGNLFCSALSWCICFDVTGIEGETFPDTRPYMFSISSVKKSTSKVPFPFIQGSIGRKLSAFSGAGSKNKDKFDLNLTDGLIPYNKNPVFLGVSFDEFLNFGRHTDGLLKRARKRLNIIKIFSHKSWHLSHVTLKGIYNAIIGSIFTYTFF